MAFARANEGDARVRLLKVRANNLLSETSNRLQRGWLVRTRVRNRRARGERKDEQRPCEPNQGSHANSIVLGDLQIRTGTQRAMLIAGSGRRAFS